MSKVMNEKIRYFFNGYTSEERVAIVKLVLEGYFNLGVKIKEMKEIDEELEELKPTEIFKLLSSDFIRNNGKYYYKYIDGKYFSIGTDAVVGLLRNNIETTIAQTLTIPREKLPKRLRELMLIADKIEKEIEEQRKNYKDKLKEVRVPEASGEYDDYSEVRPVPICQITVA